MKNEHQSHHLSVWLYCGALKSKGKAKRRQSEVEGEKRARERYLSKVKFDAYFVQPCENDPNVDVNVNIALLTTVTFNVKDA